MNTTTPIEFMAWDKQRKEIIKIDGISSKYEHVMTERGNIMDLSLVVPMQLTALRSMIDEPIYNNMIVMIQIGNHYLVDMFDYRKMNFLMVHELVIVGNRFQHPELLKLCK